MGPVFQDVENDSTDAFEVSKHSHPISVVVGTPMTLLEMVAVVGWMKRWKKWKGEQ